MVSWMSLSTVSKPIEMYDSIYTCKKRENTCVIFSKTFDRVSHTWVLFKLTQYNIRIVNKQETLSVYVNDITKGLSCFSIKEMAIKQYLFKIRLANEGTYPEIIANDIKMKYVRQHANV